jgi:uncharacterized membrane protein
MDFGGFIGRFHSLFVHLPIGLLVLAGIFEYISRKPKFQKLSSAVSITLFIGALFAIFSAISGWLLANRGAYIEQSLFLHRWLGISVAVLASLCWLIKTNVIKLGTSVFRSLLTIMIVVIFAAGHFGGNMTHGEGYLLDYAPSFLKNIFGKKKEEKQVYHFEKLGAIKIYTELVSPVFESHCWKCHNPDNALGGLDLTTKTSFLKGGDQENTFEAGDAYQSEIFKRITFPVSDKKAMPPSGLPLSYNQIRLIEWWINTGASFEKTLGDLDVPSDIQNLLTEEYGISFKQKSAIEAIVVAAARQEDIDLVKEKGFLLNRISENNNLLDVEYKGQDEEISTAQFDALLKIKNQITWLALPHSKINENQMAIISQMQNLTRLRLQNNPITDDGVQKIENLPVLESLNLNETAITDDALKSIKNLPKLKSLYIWQTKISDEAIEQLKSELPDLEIVQGFKFEKTEKEKAKK